MKLKIYGIKNCDTMKKALAWLDSRQIDYEFHDYKRNGVPAAKLKEWAGSIGWEKLINWRGPTWRGIPEPERENLTETRALALLEQNASAIKRPIVETGSSLILGFDPTEYEAQLSRT